MSDHIIKIDSYTIGEIINLLNSKTKIKLSEENISRLNKNRKFLEDKINEPEAIYYGINTGFGSLCNERISHDDLSQLQTNLVRSHACGTGYILEEKLCRLIFLMKILNLSKAYSGVRSELVVHMIKIYNESIVPVIYEQGSLGASGDLAPLAHLFLPLIGLGEVFYNNRQQPTGNVLQHFSLAPIQLGPKEGLALINGTQFILSFAIKGVQRMHNCLEAADIIGAMSLEALSGTKAPFDERLHNLRPFNGNKLVAQRLRLLLKDSDIMQSHVDCGRVQDPYSLRCMPQVHGASRNAWLHLKELTEIELNSVTDNPIILSANDTISGGNFHGQPLALPLDYCCFAAAEIGNISDRRCYLLLEGKWGLPMLLMKDVGLNSGFMIPQYTTAALVTENKTLCFPASADSIPTSLGQEDHVSMGSISGRKLNRVLDNLEYIMAIELLSAAQAIEFRKPLKSSPMLEFAHDYVRKFVGFAEEDRIFADDINKVTTIIKDFSFVEKVNEFASAKKIELNKEYEVFA